MHGSMVEKALALQQRFPREPGFKELRGYMIDANITGSLANSLEQLHDDWRLNDAAGANGCKG